MKLVIKIFDILTLIGSIVAVVISAICGIMSFAGNQTMLEQTAKQQNISIADAKSAMVVVGVFFLIIAVYYLFTAILCIVTLKKIKNPMPKKPIALGVLNILFCNIISGICLLCWSDYDKE